MKYHENVKTPISIFHLKFLKLPRPLFITRRIKIQLGMSVVHFIILSACATIDDRFRPPSSELKTDNPMVPEKEQDCLGGYHDLNDDDSDDENSSNDPDENYDNEYLDNNDKNILMTMTMMT